MFLLTKNKMNKMISQTANEKRSNEVPITTSVHWLDFYHHMYIVVEEIIHVLILSFFRTQVMLLKIMRIHFYYSIIFQSLKSI